MIEVHAPHTGLRIGEIPIESADEVKAAVQRARTAQSAWGALDVAERAHALGKLRLAIVAAEEELVPAIVAETGKPLTEALHEVIMVADMCAYCESNAARVLARQPIPTRILKNLKSYLYYSPFGVVGVISPWNYPFSIPLRGVVTALAAGNAVVLKPSERTSLMMIKFKHLFDKTGIDADLFHVVTGDGATGSSLIEAGIDKLVFTGAVSTGRKVAAACGAQLIPHILELGGKAAMIVCHDAHLERAARAAVFGGFVNSGQVCISIERVYAHESIYKKFVERVTALTKSLRQGNPEKELVDVGAIIFEKQIEVANHLIADAVKQGARIMTGGALKPGPGRFFPPTVIAGCTQAMAVMREEIFGPLLPIMQVKDENEAITLANDSDLGLFHYAFTNDQARGKRIAEALRAGTVMVNDVMTGYALAEAPFGGVKQSGYGREHGAEGLRQMSEVRHIAINRLPWLKRDPYWFPYNQRIESWLRRLMRWILGRNQPPNWLT